ncbi:hypothetical protein BOVAB4_89 [Bacteroides ovatus]|nr:hypothetical protein BOVAB4_89 [Bacteroides ovatus]
MYIGQKGSNSIHLHNFPSVSDIYNTKPDQKTPIHPLYYMKNKRMESVHLYI